MLSRPGEASALPRTRWVGRRQRAKAASREHFGTGKGDLPGAGRLVSVTRNVRPIAPASPGFRRGSASGRKRTPQKVTLSSKREGGSAGRKAA